MKPQYVIHAVNAELMPKIPIPTKANAIQRLRLCVRSKLSEKSCKATDAIIPANES
jgi:hypothetical protein